MGIELRVGWNDHRVVEDFVSSNRTHGVSALVFDAKNLGRHSTAIEAARSLGVPIVVETLTERLAEPGYKPGSLEYSSSYPFGPSELMRGSEDEIVEFVRRVAEPQLAIGADWLVPPHFYAESLDQVRFNVGLARLMAHAYGDEHRLRAVCAVPRKLLANSNTARQVALLYKSTGIPLVELRLSPLGGENEGSRKIGSVFEILRVFSEFELDVILGQQGIIGETAFAAGLVIGFSSGIGERETYNFKSAIASQRLTRESLEADRKKPRRGPPRVLLPNIDLNVSQSHARRLLSDPKIRSRLICGLETCGQSIDGPLQDPRRHYIHSRSAFVQGVESVPGPIRVLRERDRLQVAIELRQRINREKLLGVDVKLGTRTLRSLKTGLDQFFLEPALGAR